MPMPVSSTAKRISPRDVETSRDTVPPWGVNLTALLSRFSNTCRTLRPSALRTSPSGPAKTWRRWFLAVARGPMTLAASSQSAATLQDDRSSETPAVLILAMSRMSLIRKSRCVPFCSICRSARSWPAFRTQKVPSKRSSDSPRIPCKGVRNSWLVAAMKPSRERSAVWSSALASSSFRVRSWTLISRSLFRRWISSVAIFRDVTSRKIQTRPVMWPPICLGRHRISMKRPSIMAMVESNPDGLMDPGPSVVGRPSAGGAGSPTSSGLAPLALIARSRSASVPRPPFPFIHLASLRTGAGMSKPKNQNRRLHPASTPSASTTTIPSATESKVASTRSIARVARLRSRRSCTKAPLAKSARATTGQR